MFNKSINIFINNSISYNIKSIRSSTQNLTMKHRMISENMIQCSVKGKPFFTAHAKYLAYLTETQKNSQTVLIKITSYCKELKQYFINLQNYQTAPEELSFFFTNYQEKAYFILFNRKLRRVELMMVKDDGKQILVEKLERFEKIIDVSENQDLLLILKDNTKNEKQIEIMGYHYRKDNIIPGIGQLPKERNGKIIINQGKNIFYIANTRNSNTSIKILSKTQQNLYNQVNIELQNLNTVVTIYKDRFIFLKAETTQEIQIFDIFNSKIIGKIQQPEGKLVHIELKDNLLMLVCNVANTDTYAFYVLNKQVKGDHPKVITHSYLCEKGKGSYFSLQNHRITEISSILQGKIKPSAQNNSKVFMVYMIPVNKQKVQLIQINSQKLLQNNFTEQTVDLTVRSKVRLRENDREQIQGIKHQQKIEMEGHRFEASRQQRKGKKNIQEIQAKLIQRLFQTKMKGIIQRFDRLQQKLSVLESQIQDIYIKIERSVESINREQVKKNVDALFQKITPKFETYFNEVFKQLSGVMEQGQMYYKTKLAKQANIHRDALSKMINMTFDATRQIIELGQKQLKLSESTNKNLQKLLEIYEKWKKENKGLMEGDDDLGKNEQLMFQSHRATKKS